ncbi:MAG: hypothetical protein Q9227_002853 [Pyrenula ochraceoflavens]
MSVDRPGVAWGDLGVSDRPLLNAMSLMLLYTCMSGSDVVNIAVARYALTIVNVSMSKWRPITLHTHPLNDRLLLLASACPIVQSRDELPRRVNAVERERKSKPENDTSRPSPSTTNSSEDQTKIIRPEESSQSIDPKLLPGAPSVSWSSLDLNQEHHVPHLIYQTQAQRPRTNSSISQTSQLRRPSLVQQPLPFAIPTLTRPYFTPSATPGESLPTYIRPLPPRLMSDDIEYLQKKGALAVPDLELRNELLRSYILYIHPYTPLLDLQDFLRAVQRTQGNEEPISLLLFQAVMFAAIAYVDINYLQRAGFESRRRARKFFFQKARLLYDFDYETDRLTLVQSLLLMTNWYETPDDQKDTWHWMGVSLSVAQTIGLHRDPSHSGMPPQRQSLWKRVWWSCFMRDRLIALGMRRPTRIKHDDCDVPMLDLGDFDLNPLSADTAQMLGDCSPFTDAERIRELAVLCIEKAKLSLCISRVLGTQYSVLSHKFGGSTETTMMLVPKKSDCEQSKVMDCQRILDEWLEGIPSEASEIQKSMPFSQSDTVLLVHRSLLKMIYQATSSALHRPQVLPSSPLIVVSPELQELSRTKVREAAEDTTSIAQYLYTMNLTRFLPTTAVTVLLPAIIIHLLGIKSTDASARATSLQQFSVCMKILHRLREMYASADYATSFLDAAIRKANITANGSSYGDDRKRLGNSALAVWNGEGRIGKSLTPPPESTAQFPLPFATVTDGESQFLSAAATPPGSEGQGSQGSPDIGGGDQTATLADLMNFAHEAELSMNDDFDDLINFEALSDMNWAVTDDGGAQGENGALAADMNWLSESMPAEGSKSVTGDIEKDLKIQAAA